MEGGPDKDLMRIRLNSSHSMPIMRPVNERSENLGCPKKIFIAPGGVQS